MMAAAKQIISMTKDSCCVYCFARPDEMIEPRVLPCGHPACDQCIQHQNSTLHLECKSCKQIFRDLLDISKTLPRIPDEYIAGVLHDDGTLTNPEYPCSMCTQAKVEAITCCTTCSRRFCDDHAVEHQIHASDHNIIPLLYESSPERYATQRCVKHPRYILDELCVQCDGRFCSRCVVKATQCPSGEPHSVVSVKEVADGKRGKVAQLSRDLYDKMKRCRAVEKEAWRKLSDYEDEVSGFCDEIDKESEALVNHIRYETEKLKKEFRDHLQMTTDKVLKFSEEILNDISHLDVMYRRGEELAQKSSDNEVHSEFARVTNQFRHDTQNMDLERLLVMQRVTLSKAESTFVLNMRLVHPKSPAEISKHTNHCGAQPGAENYTDSAYGSGEYSPSKPYPRFLQFLRANVESDRYSGVCWKSDKTILCAVNGGVEVRSSDLTLLHKVQIQGHVQSAYSVRDKLITKVRRDNKFHSVYIGTEGNPTQTLIYDVIYEGYGYVSHMHATSTTIAFIDYDKRQLRVYNIAGNHLYNINLTGMKSPYGVHILPDNTVLVTDCGVGGDLRKYPLKADAEPIWILADLDYPTGVTSDESGHIYVKCSKGKKKIKFISTQGEVIRDLYSPHIETELVRDISICDNMMLLSCADQGVKLFNLKMNERQSVI